MMARSQEKKGTWTPEEDGKLIDYMKEHPKARHWKSVPKAAGLNRTRKSCRMRWDNYLRPDIMKGEISEGEHKFICGMYEIVGPRWSFIAAQLKRAENDVKNYFHTKLKKKLAPKGKVPKLHSQACTWNGINGTRLAEIRSGLPPQGVGHFNYQDMEDPAQSFLALSPQGADHFNYQAMEDPAQSLLSLPPQGSGPSDYQVMEDTAQSLVSLLRPGAVHFYYPSMEYPQFNNHHQEVLASSFPNVTPNALVSEHCMSTDQVEKITPAQAEIPEPSSTSTAFELDQWVVDELILDNGANDYFLQSLNLLSSNAFTYY